MASPCLVTIDSRTSQFGVLSRLLGHRGQVFGRWDLPR